MDIQIDEDRQLMIWYGNDDFGYLFEREKMTSPIINTFDLLKTNGLDLGCGKRKSLPVAIGVDEIRGPTLPFGWFSNPDIVADVNDLPFKDESIDWVTAAHLIEHMSDPVASMNEWLRVLKKGGVISLIVPIAEFVGRMGSDGADSTHKHDYTIESFMEEVIMKLDVEILAYNTYKNNWSFDCVVRKV